MTIEANGGTVRLQQRTVSLDRIAAMLDLGRDDVTIERAELAAEGATRQRQRHVRTVRTTARGH